MSLLLYNNALPSRSPLDLDSYILSVAEEGKLGEYAFVLPTGRKVRELERRLTDKHYEQTNKPLTHLPLFTMSSFTEALYDQLAPGRREASMEIQIALIERAMKSVDLNYFARPGRDPSLGVVEQVTRVISGVRADGILPTQFEMDIQAAQENPELMVGYDTVKLRDLYNIYSEYLRILGDTWIDYPGRILRVNTELFNNPDILFLRSFPDVHTLLIHDHTEFTWPEIDLVTRLGVVENLNALLVFDYEEGNGPLYGNFEEVIEKLKVGGYGTERLDPIDLDVPEEQRRPFTHHMRRNLFRTDERIANPAFDERIGIYSFHTREEEVRGIAGLVKSLVFDEGIPPERICITTLNMENYTELLREYLPSYGIPANITARYPLEQNGLITALFSALNILAAGYDRRDVLRAVTSPYLSFGEDVDPAALADAGTKLRITRGYQGWRRRIGRRIEFLLTRLRSGLDLDERRGLEIELETLRRAERSIELVHDTLGEFSTHLSPTEFRAAFLRLIAKLKGTENILHIRRNLEAQPRTPADWQRIHDEMERDTRALARFLGLLDELTELFELDAVESESRESRVRESESREAESRELESRELESREAESRELESREAESRELESREARQFGLHRLGYYLDHLRTAAARSFYTIREKHDYGLLVTHLDQVQGETFDVVIMCGLVDGEFPSTYIPANFLGKPLENTEERQLRRERIAFYSGLTSFSERIYITYPRTQGDRELVRSSFLDALIRITTVEESGRVVPYKELRIEREERRRGTELVPDRDFPAMVATLDVLSEEAGTVLWKGGTLPRVEEGKEILDHLKHTVAVEAGRAKADEDVTLAAEYRGILTDALTEEERALLAERRDNEYSASQLETYAKCPFKYFTRRLLNVDAPARFDVTLTPLERGVLVHAVLFKLYSELREKDELPISHENRDEVINRAQEIAEQEIEGITLDHPYWKIDQERLLGSAALNGLIEQWIDGEIARSEEKTELVPEFFEVSFGKGGSSGSSTDPILSKNEEIELYDVKVRGKVDRVEIFRQGDVIYYAVADYKTGLPPSRGDIEKGLSLQLMIYLEVIRHVLAQHFNLPLENIRPSGGIYYRLNAREVTAKDTYLFVPNELKGELIKERKYKRDPETVEELEARMEEAFTWADQYVQGISTGVYHVTPHDVNKICRGCEYHSICRVWEVGRPEV